MVPINTPTQRPVAVFGDVVVETHDEWAVAQRRYLSEESMAKLNQPDRAPDEETPLAITA